MKRAFFPLVLAAILLMNAAPARGVESIETASGYIITDAVSFKIVLANQDPYPAEPGGYVNLLFKIENWGTVKAENVIFELSPEYPFSLDPGVNAITELGTIGGVQTGKEALLVKYKVKVDKDAVNSEYEMKVKYAYGDMAPSTKTFNVTIYNPRTDFDVVVQDLTATSTTLAIANIGTNTGYSVIVRIPEQENFRTTGVSANVIGNLDAGDYTLVSFQISSVTWTANASSTRGAIPPARDVTNISAGREKNLTVEISYTDTLGIRRTVQKEVQIDMSGVTGEQSGAQITRQSQQQIFTGNGFTYIAIGVAGIVVLVAFFKFRKRKKK